MKKTMRWWLRGLLMAVMCLGLMQTVPAQAETVEYGKKAEAEDGEKVTLKQPEIEFVYKEAEGQDAEELDASASSKLSDREKMVEICDRVRSALLKGKESVDISDLNIPYTSKYEDMLDTLDYYCPYFDDYGIDCGICYYDSSEFTELTWHTYYSSSDVKLFISDVDKGLKRILDSVDTDWSYVNQCLAVHDYMTAHFEYDTSYYRYSSSDFLTSGCGVCQAYSYLYKYILDRLGITCYTSQSSRHMWNIVRLNSKNYIVDVTWDDPIFDQFGQADHTWFLITDSQMMKLDSGGAHVKDSSHPCTSTTYTNSYFRDIDSPICISGSYRYMIKDYNLVRYNPSTKSTKTLAESSDNGCFYYNGKIYFSNGQKIMIYTISTGKVSMLRNCRYDIVGIRKEGSMIACREITEYPEVWTAPTQLTYETKKFYLAAPADPTLKSVVKYSTGLKASWSKVSGASGYEVQYSTSKSFTTKTSKTTTSTYKNILSLTKGKTYYVRVRAYTTKSGKKYYSAWSSTKSVKIS